MRTTISPTEECKVEERRRRLYKRIKVFRGLQQLHSPVALWRIREEEDSRLDSPEIPKAEDIKLWLPSALSLRDRMTGCAPGLAEMEAKLREARCYEVLAKIRNQLYTKRFLITYRNTHISGQRANARSQTIIDSLTQRINIQASKYRQARSALLALWGDGTWCKRLRILKAEDLRIKEEVEKDDYISQKLGLIGTNKSRIRRWVKEHGRSSLSWIWLSLDEDGEEKHVCEGKFVWLLRFRSHIG
jgi:hypothetical protein